MNLVPSGVRLRKKSNLLELSYPDGSHYALPAEFLRVYSPSAEVKGHGHEQGVLQTGKRRVKLSGIQATGNYAVRLSFDDGHDTGIYSWEYLYQLCTHQQTLWQAYLDKLRKANASRDPLPPGTQAITIVDPPSKSPAKHDKHR